jgi:ferredoxin-thioredoxin reductase catalytic subunit
MPGPVSDSYDPEFGTGENADDVRAAIEEVAAKFSYNLNSERQYIVDVVRGEAGREHRMTLSEREMRIVRFGLEYATSVI